MEPGFIVLIVVALAVLIAAFKSFRVVGQASVMVIERLGKFHTLASSGLNVILPFVDKPRPVYWSGIRPGMMVVRPARAVARIPPAAGHYPR